jgi:hypothetical protein
MSIDIVIAVVAVDLFTDEIRELSQVIDGDLGLIHQQAVLE